MNVCLFWMSFVLSDSQNNDNDNAFWAKLLKTFKQYFSKKIYQRNTGKKTNTNKARNNFPFFGICLVSKQTKPKFCIFRILIPK